MLSRCALAFWVLLLTATSATAAKPNVVIFLADDAGWGDYSANGNTTIKTPNIDSIAKQGVTVDRFFVCPLCAPTSSSRAAITRAAASTASQPARSGSNPA